MGENRYLGRITSTGTSVNNLTTAAPFAIPAGVKLTLYADAACRVLTDNPSTALSGTTTGFPVAAMTPFPTSIGKYQNNLIGTTTQTAIMAMISVTGTVNLDVWLRVGDE